MHREWRVGVRFAGTLALLGLAALGLALAAWGPGFWFSVVTSLQNPVTWDQFLYQWRYVCTQPLFVAVLAGYGLTVAWVLRHRGVAALRDSPWLCYSFCAWAVLLLTIGKTGAAANYFIEPFLASLLWLASVAGVSGRNGRPGWQALCSAVVLTGLAGAELSSANPRLHYTFLHSGLGARYASFRAFAGAEMASLEWRDPKVLNLLMPRVTYDFGRDAYLNDCFHYRLLWRDGKLSPRSLIEALRRHAFDCVILPEDGFTGERAENPALGQIVDAVREYYLDRGVKARIRFFVRPP
jgi:hypothetical protein